MIVCLLMCVLHLCVRVFLCAHGWRSGVNVQCLHCLQDLSLNLETLYLSGLTDQKASSICLSPPAWYWSYRLISLPSFSCMCWGCERASYKCAASTLSTYPFSQHSNKGIFLLFAFKHSLWPGVVYEESLTLGKWGLAAVITDILTLKWRRS